MEGPLKKYKNILSGYKACFGRIMTSQEGHYSLIIQGNAKNSKSVKHIIPLRKAIVEN